MTDKAQDPQGAAEHAARIVVGIDGSQSSIDAMFWAARQAELTKATLDVVMTWEWPTSYGWAIPVPDAFDPEAEMRVRSIPTSDYCAPSTPTSRSTHASCTAIRLRFSSRLQRVRTFSSWGATATANSSAC